MSRGALFTRKKINFHVTFPLFSYYKGEESNKKRDEYEKSKRGVLW